MSNKKPQRITRRERIKAMPAGKVFTFEMLGLNVDKSQFYQNAKLLQPHLKIIGKGAGRKYYITKRDKSRLLKMETKVESGGLTREKKGHETYELRAEDILHNLFEGIKPTKEQLKLI